MMGKIHTNALIENSAFNATIIEIAAIVTNKKA